ncbi:MAG: threonyl-tRNA synthetase [Candidatus Woesearchaeota archaeon]|nr:threonyl-tRNA synthetase [Candidatus Woesearchaeota archaeon]MDN5327941.1 threonyl-tRNA synthetase [Candidatus Woesearchaeota archaeon]
MSDEKIKIKFPDGDIVEYPKGITALEIVEGISKKLAKKTIAAKLNDKVIDLFRPIEEDGSIVFLTFDDNEGKQVFWHSASHILAQAVKRLYPQAKLAIGPAIENGFYYDFDDLNISEQDLEKIENEMKKIIKENQKFTRKVISKEQALDLFKNEPYKLELINDLDDKVISIYSNGDFVDLCRGPHVVSTGVIKAVKLTKLAGAYWRGDSNNKMLTRIYGIAFPSEEQLKQYLHFIEEAQKRDHRKLGKQLRLFSLHEEGPGFPFWLPRGMVIFNTLIDFWREEHRKAGYVEIKTPIMLNKALWVRSGHWDNYRENMYLTKVDNEEFAIKPMNCPGGMLVYKEEVHSYKELPLRVGEIGLVHRHELSGVLSGLFRVRAFHQDDAHIFMRPDQIKDEILGVLQLADKFYSIFGLDYHLELSTRPEKSIGTDEQWEQATTALEQALKATGRDYKVNEGDGAFYGPKIDIHIKDAIGRTWQCGTIQLDMSLPERFDLTYMGEDGENKHRPVMIHRVIYGSLERFIGILIEHFAGKFPLWLAPEQVRVIPVSNNFNDYAEEVYKKLFDLGFRVEKDFRDETVSKKIRDAQLMKVNYIIVVGEKEKSTNTVNVRDGRENKVLGQLNLDDFIASMKKEIEEKRL